MIFAQYWTLGESHLLRLLFGVFCKRLPSHTGQEQACTRITWLFGCSFVTMPQMAEYTENSC